MLGKEFQAGDDEENIATLLASKDLADNPAIQQAIDQMTTAASNVCRVFFPKKLIVSGPFVKNTGIWQAFCAGFEQQNSFFGQTIQQLSVSQVSRDPVSTVRRYPYSNKGSQSCYSEDAFLYGPI